MKRVYNFSAGPAMLPEAVLRRAQTELLDWKGSGMSVMEVSHRGSEFIDCAADAERRLRSLLGVPEHYKVLFMAGGATAQFAAVPLNIAPEGSTADYVITGSWGKKAAGEAARYCKVNVAADSEPSRYTEVPAPDGWQLTPGAAYAHITPNETIVGVEFHEFPDVGDVPLVADMSSTILSRPLDVERFGIIYAGAQKNIGPAGLGIVIVREDLIGRARRQTPGVFDYKIMAEADSMWNTPPTFSWYLAGLVFEWLEEQGGLTAMGARNREKAEALYRAIDASGFYSNPVQPDYRSWMNIPFTLADAALDKQFLAESKDAGLTNLKGHRLVGGMRASLYNAMPLEGVQALIEFMADFEKRRG